MTVQKHIARFWTIFCVILAMALGAITVVLRWHRIFPSDEVSETYLKYAGRENMDVSFVKGYRVNDTVVVDVTLLETKDSATWDSLCLDFSIVPLSKYPMDSPARTATDHTFFLRLIKDTVVTQQDTLYKKTLIIFSHKDMSMCVFHNVSDMQYDAILDKKSREI